MKAFNALALFYVFVSVTLAVPVPVQQEHPPLPGRSDYHTAGGITTIYEGDDRLPEHMRHLQRNQELHPENKDPMILQKANTGTNRKSALNDRETVKDLSRDEKPPNMFIHPMDTTTVEFRSSTESSIEGGITGPAARAIRKFGKNAKAQMRPHPGWLPFDPNQQRGHEAPAKMETAIFDDKTIPKRTPTESKWSRNNQAAAVGRPPGLSPPGEIKGSEAAKKRKEEAWKKWDGEAKEEWKNRAEQKSAKKAILATTLNEYLRPGTPEPPAGHVQHFDYDDKSKFASHFGAKAPPSNSHERQPPRPRDQVHYEIMKKQDQKEKLAQEAQSKIAQKISKKILVHNDPDSEAGKKYKENLQKFNNLPGVAPPKLGDGHHHSVEWHPSTLHSSQPLTSHNHASESGSGAFTHHDSHPPTSNSHASGSGHPLASNSHASGSGASTSHTPAHPAPAPAPHGNMPVQHPPAQKTPAGHSYNTRGKK